MAAYERRVSGKAQAPSMSHNTTSDLGSGPGRLLAEIEAYLAVVDAMRCEGIEPRWASELRSPSRDRRASGDRDRSLPKLVWGC
jgi:hypothetical protein